MPKKMPIYLKLVLTMMLWGGTFVAGRIAVQSVSPFTAAWGRFLIASACLLVMVWRVEGRLPRLTRRQGGLAVLMGLTGILSYNAFFFAGLQFVPAGRAALIIALNPIAIALGSALFLREPLTSQKILGIIISLCGAAWVITQGQPLQILSGGVGLGELLILGCVLSWMAYTLTGKAAMGQMSPLVSTAYGCFAGTVFLAVPALIGGGWGELLGVRPSALASMAYLGGLGSAVGFCWYYDGVRTLGPARAGVFINLVPVSAIILGALILQEPMTPSLLLGGMLVIIGVLTTNRG
ncbi:MAG: DMT family transporter [Cyanobacteria bacterium P01_A01_bin.105]